MKQQEGRPVVPRAPIRADLLREARVRRELSARQVGAIVGDCVRGKPFDSQTVYNWEQGRVRPSAECVVELERILKCKLRTA